MGYLSLDISVIAILPALFLVVFIYCKDKIEKEPIGLLFLLFGLGAVAYVPALVLEKSILNGIDKLFEDKMIFSAEGIMTYSSGSDAILHKLLTAFLGMALVEVLLKWVVLLVSTYKNRHFNYLFDGVVYSVFVSLGFAAADNLRFAWVNGWDMLVLRSIASVPGHLIVGIIMGYFYTVWNAYRKARSLEQSFLEKGILREVKIKKPVGRLLLSILMPLAVAGAYMTAAAMDSKLGNALFYFAVFCLYGFSFLTIEKLASKDRNSLRISFKLVKKMHPEADSLTVDRIDGSGKGEQA